MKLKKSLDIVLRHNNILLNKKNISQNRIYRILSKI